MKFIMHHMRNESVSVIHLFCQMKCSNIEFEIQSYDKSLYTLKKIDNT